MAGTSGSSRSQDTSVSGLFRQHAMRTPCTQGDFTQSYLDALRDVQAIGRETRLSGEGIAARVPALKIGRFTFTGVTE